MVGQHGWCSRRRQRAHELAKSPAISTRREKHYSRRTPGQLYSRPAYLFTVSVTGDDLQLCQLSHGFRCEAGMTKFGLATDVTELFVKGTPRRLADLAMPCSGSGHDGKRLWRFIPEWNGVFYTFCSVHFQSVCMPYGSSWSWLSDGWFIVLFPQLSMKFLGRHLQYRGSSHNERGSHISSRQSGWPGCPYPYPWYGYGRKQICNYPFGRIAPDTEVAQIYLIT